MEHAPRPVDERAAAGPRFVLRGSTSPAVHDVVLFGLLLGALLMFFVVIRTVLLEAGVGAMIFSLVLTSALIVALVSAWRTSQALFVIYHDRAVIDSRPQGSDGQRVVVVFRDLRSVMRDGGWIRMRRRDERMFAFRGNRLHIEDAFDTLVSCLDTANPDCVILNRG